MKRWFVGQTTNDLLFIADIDADGLSLKRRHFIRIKSPKVICRAVHDATFHNTTRELKNFCCIGLLLYYRFKLLKNSTLERVSGYSQN